MKPCAFEIKIALLGNVSVGKTTLLNALLGDKFSEVSKKRTTAGINHFRIASIKPEGKDKPDNEEIADNNHERKKSSKRKRCDDDNNENDEVIYAADDTFTKVTQDNIHLRKSNIIQEHTFNIELDEPLFEMRCDTKLVITDLPGVNEAGTSKMYLDFVTKSWDTFDCVIIVMDAVQGVNTDEQVGILKFVQNNIEKYKNIPVIVLCNKVDDPDDPELMTLVNEVKNEVEKIFNVSDRNSSLESILNKEADMTAISPMFLPISAENAFLYRAASKLQLVELDKLDAEYIKKIGHEEVGKAKWRHLSKTEKHKVVYEVVSDSKQYQDRLENSNFDKLLKVLSFIFDGKEHQAKVIEKQLEVSLKKLSCNEGFANQLLSIFEKSNALGRSTLYLKEKFWSLYNACKKESFDLFMSDPLAMSNICVPMVELQEYKNGFHKNFFLANKDMKTEKKEDEGRIMESMTVIIKKYCKILSKKHLDFAKTSGQTPIIEVDPWNYSKGGYSYKGQTYDWAKTCPGQSTRSSLKHFKNGTEKDHPEADKYDSHFEYKEEVKLWISKYTGKTKALRWSDLSFRDWSSIFSSILLMKYDKYFCVKFSNEIIDLEWHQKQPPLPNFCLECQTGADCGCNKNYFDISSYQSHTKINMGASPTDNDHWGHLVWLFCDFMGQMERTV